MSLNKLDSILDEMEALHSQASFNRTNGRKVPIEVDRGDELERKLDILTEKLSASLNGKADDEDELGKILHS